MSIKQREDEILRSYIASFNKEALSIDEVDDKILVAVFTNRLQNGKFLFSLYKNDSKTTALTKTHFWPERRNPGREKDRKTCGRTKGRRW